MNPLAGGVIISAVVEETSGTPLKRLILIVPSEMAKPPGTRFAVYDREAWALAQSNQKIDETKLKPITLPFKQCDPLGCTAEMDLPDSFLRELQAGSGVMVLAINVKGQPIGFPVPLDGFNATLAGPPGRRNNT